MSPPSPTIAEDVLLLLFDPRNGAFAGEGTLHHVLGGAVLTELALTGQVEIEKQRWTARVLPGTSPAPPADPILREAHDRLTPKPRDTTTALMMIGPPLRAQVIDRLVERGELHAERRRRLGLFTTTSLTLAGARRPELIARVHAVLINGIEPDPRTAATIALLSAGGHLHSLDPEIPWGRQVAARGKEIEKGDWGADAVSSAVSRAVMGAIAGAVAAAVATGVAIGVTSS